MEKIKKEFSKIFQKKKKKGNKKKEDKKSGGRCAKYENIIVCDGH
ncbi:MAG: hypothetical protein PVJ67_05455 [Candidatus Pacearchaeota archaeon]|jgi:hypothetical protein